MTPENDKMKPDAYIHVDCHGDKRLTFTGKLGAKAALTAKRSGWNFQKVPLYSLSHPAIQGLVDAAKLQVLNFERQNASDEFLGDDDHEAWSALTAALAQLAAERKETQT